MVQQMTHMQHARAVLALGVPLIIIHLAQFSIHMVDTLMVGWHSVEELAALVLAGSFWFTIFIVLSGFGFALMPMVATAAASNDEVEIRRATRMAMWLSILSAIVFMPPMYWAEQILLAIGQDAEVSQLAGAYLKIAGWGMIPALMVGVFKSYFSALERTQFILWMIIAAVFLNGVLNYALIFGNWGMPELGVRGAAIASVAVNTFLMLVLCVYAYLAMPQHALFQRVWRPDWTAFARVFQLGWPIGITSLAEVGLFVGAAVYVGWIGTNELAAHGIALQIASATFMVHIGISSAATVRAGRAVGRMDEDGLRRGGLVATVISAMFVLATVFVFYLFGEALAGLFVDPNDPLRPEIIAIASILILFAAAFQAADAGQVMALGLLRGVQDTRVPMIMAAVSYWAVAMPAGYVLGFPMGYGVYGVWSGLVIGLAVAWVLMTIRFWGRSVKIGQAA